VSIENDYKEKNENVLIGMMKKKKHRRVTTTILTITTTKVKPSVGLCVLDTNVVNVQGESDSFFSHWFFTRKYNMQRLGGPEGVSRCIADARKANLHPHAHTHAYIYTHTSHH
jgi:hypothetical protein